MNITDVFIDNIYTFSKSDFSETVLIHAKKCLIDYIGVVLAGVKAYDDVEKKLLDNCVSDGNISTIIGYNRKSSAPVAALINGISAHAVELDDGQRFGNIHPGAPIISALLSVAEYSNSTIADLLKGILTGYECAIRLSCSVQPGHKLKGFHATGPCGTIGASMGIAAMLDFSKDQFKAALSVACTSASGILEMIEGDTQLMPYNAGKAASNAVISAAVAYSGFKCPDDALGGNRGFLNCFADHPRTEILMDFSDQLYCTTNYFKLYAACGHCHSSIEASLRLRDKYQFNIDEIESIDVQTYQLALRGHDHKEINGVNSARMSIPYSVAVALIHGSADIKDFDEQTIQEAQLLKLVSKITVRENAELTKLAPAKRIAIVTVQAQNGSFSETITWPKGQPENPLTMEDIKKKCYKCASYAGWSLEVINKIIDTIITTSGEMMVKDLLYRIK